VGSKILIKPWPNMMAKPLRNSANKDNSVALMSKHPQQMISANVRRTNYSSQWVRKNRQELS